MARMRGKIVRLVSDKGYGFIERDGHKKGDKDVFFHATDLPREVKFKDVYEGQVLEFELVVNAENGKCNAKSITI